MRQRSAKSDVDVPPNKDAPVAAATSTPPSSGGMLVDAPDRWKTWWIRTYTTIAMIIGFAAIIYVGYASTIY